MGCELQTIADDETLYDWTAARIAEGLVVGWFQGRMEWGARALGNRSILADPRRADMREIINTKIKFREKFRPFAPSVLDEAHAHYFTGSVPDPFMMQVYPVQPRQAGRDSRGHARGRIGPAADREPRRQPALLVAHPRVRAPHRRADSAQHVVQRERADRATSPSEALDCFLRTRMDVLVLGNQVVTKKDIALSGDRAIERSASLAR